MEKKGSQYWFTKSQNDYLKRVAAHAGIKDQGLNSDVKNLIAAALRVYQRCLKASPDKKTIVILGQKGQEVLSLVDGPESKVNASADTTSQN